MKYKETRRLVSTEAVRGDGVYGLKADEQLGKGYMSQVVGKNTKLGKFAVEGGCVRATVNQPVQGDPTLTFDFYSVSQSGSQPYDSCVLNLKTRKIV
jgi:hypothetical protein